MFVKAVKYGRYTGQKRLFPCPALHVLQTEEPPNLRMVAIESKRFLGVGEHEIFQIGKEQIKYQGTFFLLS